MTERKVEDPKRIGFTADIQVPSFLEANKRDEEVVERQYTGPSFNNNTSYEAIFDEPKTERVQRAPKRKARLEMELSLGTGAMVTFIIMLAVIFFSLGWLTATVTQQLKFNEDMRAMYKTSLIQKQELKLSALNEYGLRQSTLELTDRIVEKDVKIASLTAKVTEVAAAKAEAKKVAAIAPLVSTSRGASRTSFCVTTPSLVSAAELDEVLAGTGMAGLGKAFYDAEKSTGVNALVAIGIGANESGWGASGIGNNLFGIKAGSSWKGKTRTVTTREVVAGKTITIRAKFRDYDSKYDAVQDLALLLKNNYLTKGDIKYTLDFIGRKYASDPRWSSKVFANVKTLARRIAENRKQ